MFAFEMLYDCRTTKTCREKGEITGANVSTPYLSRTKFISNKTYAYIDPPISTGQACTKPSHFTLWWSKYTLHNRIGYIWRLPGEEEWQMAIEVRGKRVWFTCYIGV